MNSSLSAINYSIHVYLTLPACCALSMGECDISPNHPIIGCSSHLLLSFLSITICCQTMVSLASYASFFPPHILLENRFVCCHVFLNARKYFNFCSLILFTISGVLPTLLNTSSFVILSFYEILVFVYNPSIRRMLTFIPGFWLSPRFHTI